MKKYQSIKDKHFFDHTKKPALMFNMFIQFDIQIIIWCTISRKLKIAVVPQNSMSKFIQYLIYWPYLIDNFRSMQTFYVYRKICLITQKFRIFYVKTRTEACFIKIKMWKLRVYMIKGSFAKKICIITQSYTLFASLLKSMLYFCYRFF